MQTKSRYNHIAKIQASFIICGALLYISVIGTQFKMMNIIANFESYSQHPGQLYYESNAATGQIMDNERRNNVKVSPNYKEIAASVASKWNLTAPNAVELLEKQFYKENDWDPKRDFFHFHHLYKSGGTSMSGVIDKTIGLPRKGKNFEGVLPGSYPSGDFNHEEALEDINRLLKQGMKREELPYRASYAHTGLRPVYGPEKTRTGEFFLKQLPHKRLRAIAMLRDPTDFRASNHAMIMCGLNYEVNKWNNEREQNGLERVCSPRDGLNVSHLVDRKIQALLEKCRKADEADATSVNYIAQPTVNKYQRIQCKNEVEGIDTLKHCRSAAHLLASPKYNKHYRSMFQGLMGRFHRGQHFGGTAYGRMNYGYSPAEESEGYSVQAVEEYTLEDLGGLDVTISGAGDGVGPPEPDFIWFGITERMQESMCLFYFQFKAKPLKKTPDARVQDCRPNSWWNEEDRNTVKEREPADYAVWRAANAIMDVRLTKMKMEIHDRIIAGETEETMPYVQRGCYNETFGSDGV